MYVLLVTEKDLILHRQTENMPIERLSSSAGRATDS